MNTFNDKNQQPSTNPHAATGKTMLTITWVFILLLGFAFFKWFEQKNSGAHNTTSISTSSGGIELHIPITDGNRYEVFGKINNEDVKFLIDTGATIVSIPEHVANKAGLIQGMPITINTAGGTKISYLTKIQDLTIGNTNQNIIIHNITATINPHVSDDTILLGMGALKQLDLTHAKDTLIIRQN